MHTIYQVTIRFYDTDRNRPVTVNRFTADPKAVIEMVSQNIAETWSVTVKRHGVESYNDRGQLTIPVKMR